MFIMCKILLLHFYFSYFSYLTFFIYGFVYVKRKHSTYSVAKKLGNLEKTLNFKQKKKN